MGKPRLPTPSRRRAYAKIFRPSGRSIRAQPTDVYRTYRLNRFNSLTPPAVGSRIVATGPPKTDLFRINLSKAAFRTCAVRGRNVTAAARPVAASLSQRWLHGDFHGWPVTFEGFDPERHPDSTEGHFGLLGITERLDRLNGTLTVESAPGRGATFRIRLRKGT